MNPTDMLHTLHNAEPIAWILILLVLFFTRRRQQFRHESAEFFALRDSDENVSVGSVGLFAAVRLLSSLLQVSLSNGVLPASMQTHVWQGILASVAIVLHFAAAAVALFVLWEVIRTSLSPFAELSAAMLRVFRLVSGLTFVVAVAANLLPNAFSAGFFAWGSAVHTSFSAGVCALELTVTFLVLRSLLKLGWSLRSRMVGIAIGLAFIGLADVASGLLAPSGATFAAWAVIASEAVTLFAALAWTFYILAPSPERRGHQFSPASSFMRWAEVARRLNTDHHLRPESSAPFITKVEERVLSVLQKYNIGTTHS